MVPEPDQLPANWPKGPSLEADPWVARLCALLSPPLKTKIANAKAATRNITLAGFECMEIIGILVSLGVVLLVQHPRHTLVPPMEQLEHRRGCHETPLALGSDGPVMKRAALAMALAAGFLVGGAIAQTPPDDKEPIPPRSIQLTAEQDHVIKEIVLKDMQIRQLPHNTEIRIGEKVPTEIELRTFPPLVAEKVPQVKTFKFFITENQIVIVSPQNIIADIIK
jgi:hypothetical protein